MVVGAGPNGLAAAAALARRGLRVLVLEANETIGGGCRSAELTLPGLVHDTCAAVHPLGVGSPFLRRLRLDQHGLEWVHPDAPLAHPLDGGAAAVLERSVRETAAGLGRDGRAYERLFGALARDWEALAPDLLGPPLRVPRRPLHLARFGVHALRSARGLAESLFRDEHARALFAGSAAHSLMPLERAGSAAFGLVLAGLGHAVGWPVARGGSQRVSDALASVLRGHGGSIETGRRIRALEDVPGARAVVLDLTARRVLEVAGDALWPRYRRALEKYRSGPGVFKVDWALDGPVPWQARACARAGTLHLGGTLEEIAKAERAVAQGRHPERPFVLAAQQSLFDPSRAPPGGAGKQALWAYCHVPHGSEEDMTARIEAQVERFAPGFGARVIARVARGPRAMEEHNANFIGGDISGGAQDLGQMAARPVLSTSPYSAGRGIFVCSASTPPGGGVHGMCGYHAARSVLKWLRSGQDRAQRE